jgi:ribosomal protein L17
MTLASYINLSAVKCKTAQNAAEELVILSSTETATKIASQIREIPCSDNNVQKIIVEMAPDVAKLRGGKKQQARKFALPS